MIEKIKALQKPVSERFLLGLIWGVLGILLFALALSFNDTDVYYFIPNGRYILTHGIPYENPFITTPGCKIVIQNWLYCVCIAWIYDHLHAFGFFLLEVAFLLGMVFVTLLFFDYKHSNRKAWILLFAISSLIVFGYTNLRPQMLTYLLIMAELIGINRFRESGHRRWLLLIPMTTLLEINFHASYWVMHFIVMLPYIVENPKCLPLEWDYIKRGAGWFYAAGLSAVLLLFLNPYGTASIGYVFYALASGAVSLMGIAEQVPLDTTNLMFFVLVASFCGFLYFFFRHKLKSSECFMFLGLALVYCTAVKWQPFFVVGLLYLYQALLRDLEEKDRSIPRGLVFAGVFITLLWSGKTIGEAPLAQIFDTKTTEYMDASGFSESLQYYDEICDYLDETAPGSSVYAGFASENYFEYRGYQVYNDARPELYIRAIAGNDTVYSGILKMENKCDVYAAYKAGFVKNELSNVPASYFLTAEAYSDFIYEEMAMDYYVVSIKDATKSLYFSTHPDLYRLCFQTGDYLLYERL